MAQAKKMNENEFAKLVKEFSAVGELIRARQEEKQSVMDAFLVEKKRHMAGKISTKTLESSVKKTNTELLRLDKQIRDIISRTNKLGDMAKAFASKQAPKVFRAKNAGVFLLNSGSKKKKKAPAKKKVVAKKPAVKKKVVKKKPVAKKKPAAKKKAPAKKKPAVKKKVVKKKPVAKKKPAAKKKAPAKKKK
jgi:hypothetical protein